MKNFFKATPNEPSSRFRKCQIIIWPYLVNSSFLFTVSYLFVETMRLIFIVACLLCITLTFQNMHVRQAETHDSNNHEFLGWIKKKFDATEKTGTGCTDGHCWAWCGRANAWCWTSKKDGDQTKVDCPNSGDVTNICPNLSRNKNGDNLNCVGRCAFV